MRLRILSVLLAFMTCALAAIAIPSARNLASATQQGFYLDRLNDTTRFAALAQQAGSPADLAALRADLGRYDAVYGIAVAIVGRDGRPTLVSRSGITTDSPQLRARLASALAGRASEDSPIVWPWDERPLVVATPIVHAGDVTGAAVTISPTGRLHREVLGGWAVIGLISALMLIMCVALAVRLTSWILRPIVLLDGAAHTIATGRMDARVDERSGPPELRRLAGSFNEMAGHVTESIERQRAFAADASHQLRNPLSALLLRLEHLGTALPDGWEDELNNAREEGGRLTRMLDDLLTLAAVEHTALRAYSVDVGVSLDERIDAWTAMADHKEIRFVREGAAGDDALGDYVAIRGVLDVLFSNAIKFSPPGTRITAIVRDEPEVITIGIGDEGPGLSADELARVGNRFWRSPRHQNIEGSGLGIVIARTLLAGIGGELELAPREPCGLLATVRLRKYPPSEESAAPAEPDRATA